MDMMDLVAVVVAAASSFVVGGIWYGPLFGKAWMRASGIMEEEAGEANMARVMGLSFVLQLVAAFVLMMFIGPDAEAGFAVAAAASVGLFWVAPALGVVYLFEQRSLAHWGVNAGYQIVAFTLMGMVLGFWP
jgi:hypothetical protein